MVRVTETFIICWLWACGVPLMAFTLVLPGDRLTAAQWCWALLWPIGVPLAACVGAIRAIKEP